jgi:glycosyltransferase involved in cell wall biosynthesis
MRVSGSSYHFVLPGPPETPTGGFVYDRHMLAALARAGRLAGCIALPGGFPIPSEAAVTAAERMIAAIPENAPVIVDGLALTPLAGSFAAAATRPSLLALIHHPLADETGLPASERDRLYDAERRVLAVAKGVLVTSAHTAGRLADFGVQAARIRVVRPGIEAPRPLVGAGATAAPGAGDRPTPATLLCVASLTPRKGQDVLLRALARLRQLSWRLWLVGPARDAAFSRGLRRLAHELGLQGRIRITGAVAPAIVAWFYRQADVFVLPSFYEGFGIAAAEAAAHGIPVVASDAGAIPEAIAGTRHRLVPPGDVIALAEALRPFLGRGQAVRRCLRPPSAMRSWTQAGREFIASLDELAAE